MPAADSGAPVAGSPASRAPQAPRAPRHAHVPRGPRGPERSGSPGDGTAGGGARLDDHRLAPGTPGYRRVSVALFLAGVATFAMLYSTQALLPLVSAEFRAGESTAAWTVSAATGGLALAVLPLSMLSERFRHRSSGRGGGRRTVMTASLAVAVALGLLVPFAPSVGVLVALRAAQGAALAGLPASAMAYLAEEVRPKALVAAVGLFVAGNSIGGMSGRIISGWVAQEWGWRWAVGAIGLIAVVCAALFRLLLPAPRQGRAGQGERSGTRQDGRSRAGQDGRAGAVAARGSDGSHGANGSDGSRADDTEAAVDARALVRAARDHLANPLLRRLYAIGALFMMVFGGSYTVIAYRLSGAPFSLPQGLIGSVFVIYLVGTVSSAAAGRLVNRFGRRGALYLGAGTTAAGLLVSLADSLVAVLLGLVLITAGFFAGHAVASSAVSRTAQHGRAQASALYQSGYYIGSSVGSALGAVAFRAAGWNGMVALGLLAVAGVALITLFGTRAARRHPPADPAPSAR